MKGNHSIGLAEAPSRQETSYFAIRDDIRVG